MLFLFVFFSVGDVRGSFGLGAEDDGGAFCVASRMRERTQCTHTYVQAWSYVPHSRELSQTLF